MTRVGSFIYIWVWIGKGIRWWGDRYERRVGGFRYRLQRKPITPLRKSRVYNPHHSMPDRGARIRGPPVAGNSVVFFLHGSWVHFWSRQSLRRLSDTRTQEGGNPSPVSLSHPMLTQTLAPVSAVVKLAPKEGILAAYNRLRDVIPSDAILVVRLGDFFEIFYADAQTFSRHLELTRTERNHTPMIGFPAWSEAATFDKIKAHAGRRPVWVATNEAASEWHLRDYFAAPSTTVYPKRNRPL